MESPVLTEVRSLAPHLWKSTLISGVLAVIMGALMLAWPSKTLVVAATLFGVYLLISGIAQVFFAFALHVSASGRILLFISGAASLILAVLAFRHFGEGYAVLLLAIWIAVVPMPLAPPWISSVSPGLRRPISNTLFHTVSTVSGRPAASMKPSGSGRANFTVSGVV